MFTALELDYITTLIETMWHRGYKYYVARTITESGNNNDFEIIFSKQPITANSQYSYAVSNGVRYTVDSTGYSSSSGNHARVATSNFNGTYTFNSYEFCYTNANYNTTAIAIQPDIRNKGGTNNVYVQTGFYVLVGIFLLAVLFKFFSFR